MLVGIFNIFKIFLYLHRANYEYVHFTMETFLSLFLDNNISNGIIFKICNYETGRKEKGINYYFFSNTNKR